MNFDYGNKRPDGQHERHPGLPVGQTEKPRVRPYREKYVHDTCGVETRMPAHCAEQYAVDPGYYTSTFCVKCKGYFPVGEFKWDDGSVVGS